MSVKSFDGSSCLNKKRETYRQSGYVLSLKVQSYPPPPNERPSMPFTLFFEAPCASRRRRPDGSTVELPHFNLCRYSLLCERAARRYKVSKSVFFIPLYVKYIFVSLVKFSWFKTNSCSPLKIKQLRLCKLNFPLSRVVLIVWFCLTRIYLMNSSFIRFLILN